MARVLGAHDVSYKRLYSVARVRSIGASILPIIIGLWILRHQDVLFRTPAWVELRSVVADQMIWIALPVLAGGVLGVAGLAFRSRLTSMFSCLLLICWFSWMDAFLWWANFTDAPNIGAYFCLYGLLEYVYRAALLALPPRQGEEYGRGW